MITFFFFFLVDFIKELVLIELQFDGGYKHKPIDKSLLFVNCWPGHLDNSH